MRILHEEMELREETRALEQARPALEMDAHKRQSQWLADTQGELAERVEATTRKIRELPDGDALFASEINLLTRVQQVMLEAQQLLGRHITGPETIAAETEAIELLLQTRRINPKARRRWWFVAGRWRDRRHRPVGVGAAGDRRRTPGRPDVSQCASGHGSQW